jgi:Repeats of unknown function (DUF5649)
VVLGAGVVLTGTGVNFDGTVTGAFSLGIVDSGVTKLTQGATGLASININSNSSIELGGDVSTTGAQTYQDSITLAANRALTSSGSGAISTAGATGAHTLSINTAGLTTLSGVYNNTRVITDNPGSISFASASGSALFSIGEQVLCGTLSSSGALSFGSNIEICGNTSFSSTGNGVSFGGTVNTNADNTFYTLDASGLAGVVFSGAVGNLANRALGTLSVGGAAQTTISGNITTGGSGAAGQDGGQKYNSAVILGGSVTFTNLAAATPGAINFVSTIDAAASGVFNLNVVTNNNGATKFGGSIGAGTKFLNIDTNADGTTQFASGISVNSTGNQTFADAVTALGAIEFIAGAGSVSANAVGSDFQGAVKATAKNVTLRDSGAINLGAMTLTGTLGVTAGGAVTNTGILDIDGTTKVTATGFNVTLNQANVLTGAVSATAADLTVNNTTDTVLGASTLTGNLAVTSKGNVSQTGGILDVDGTTNVTIDTTTNQDILLNTQANDLTGAVTFAVTNFGTVRDIGLRNVSATASIAGLPTTSIRDLTITHNNNSVDWS